MKKQLFILIVAILAVAFTSSKEKLALNLTKGKTYNQNMVTESTIKQQIQGQTMNIEMTITADMGYLVKEVTDQVFTMDVTYNKMAMKMSLPTGAMEYSSDKKVEGDLMSTILSNMINKPFTIKMSENGKVQEVTNIEKVFESAFTDLPNINEQQKQQILAQVMQSYGGDAIRGNLEMTTALFPETEVSKGDSWDVTTTIESGMTMTVKTTYTLTEVGPDYYLLNGVSTLETAKDKVMDNMGMPLQYNLSGTMNATLKLSKSTGWVMDGTIDQIITGEAVIQDNPQVPGGMSIPMELNNKMTISGQ